MIRVALSLGWGSSRSKRGSREELGYGIGIVINRGAGNIMRVKETGGFLRFVNNTGRVCWAAWFMKQVCLLV